MKHWFWSAVALLAAALASTGCNRNKQEAIILANQGDQVVDLNPSEAVEKYEMATQLDPSNHRIFYKLAKAYKKKEEWAKVASTLARATDVAPDNATYWWERGYALEQQAEKGEISWDEPKPAFTKCIETDPNKDECYYHLAIAHLWSDKEQEALVNFTKAIEHRPDQISYYTRLADYYIRLGYDKEAEQVLNAAKSMADPSKHKQELFNTHTLLGGIYRDRGQIEEMVKAFEDAKAVNPEDAGSLFNIGMGYAKLTPPKKSQAKSMLQSFIKRACRSKKKAKYDAECKQATAIVAKFGRVGG
jgi:tetratricopeptide (TPR) repeat protein